MKMSICRLLPALIGLTVAVGCSRNPTPLLPSLDEPDKRVALGDVEGTCKVTEKPQPNEKQKVKKNGIAFYRIHNTCAADALVRAGDFVRLGSDGAADPVDPRYQVEMTVKAGKRGILAIGISASAGSGEKDVEYEFAFYVNNVKSDPVIIVEK